MTNIIDNDFQPPSDDGIDEEGFDANNVIIQGTNNLIQDSRRCTIINGASNTIVSRYNSHVIGDGGDAEIDNAFYVACTNGIICDGDIDVFSNSDERLKDNIQPISGCLDKVLSIDGVEFDWNNNQELYSGHDLGLVAQQVSGIAPEIVSEKKNGYLGVKYEKMVPILIEAIKEQQKCINALSEKIDMISVGPTAGAGSLPRGDFKMIPPGSVPPS